MEGNSQSIPSDRQLALRAQLRIGWSAGRPDTPLSPREQELIRDVIKRNEELEQAERQRVGKLVERVENIKRRIVETGPNNCRLCGQSFGILKPSKQICDDCKKPICAKCCIDLNSRSPTRRVVWVCKVCSEMRELWKKTGAWFYKGLPNYDLPANKINNRFRSHDEMMSTHRMRRDMEFDETASSSSSENCMEAVTTTSIRPKTRLKIANGGARVLSSRRSSSLHDDRHCSLTDLKHIDHHRGNGGGGGVDASDYNADTVSQTSSTTQSFTATYNKRNSSVSSSFSVCDSSSPLGYPPGNGGLLCSVGISGGIYGSDTLNMNSPFRDPVVGWLEISVAYDESNHCLNCVILRARDLPAMDSAGLADPFCKVNVISVTSPGYEQMFKYAKWVKTKVVPRTLCPEFNEPFRFIGIGPDELELSILYVLVLDNDKYGHDLLGIGKFKLHSLLRKTSTRMSLPLSPSDLHVPENQHPDDWSNGRLLLSLCYNTKRRALIVLIKQCEDLLPMDNNGCSDPFIKLHLKPDHHRKKFKTAVKWRTLNPVYNEEFCFETRPNEMDKQMLVITVWDKDIGKSDDFLGSLIIGYNSKGARLQQWKDCVRLPDHHHERWHWLSNEQPKHH